MSLEGGLDGLMPIRNLEFQLTLPIQTRGQIMPTELLFTHPEFKT